MKLIKNLRMVEERFSEVVLKTMKFVIRLQLNPIVLIQENQLIQADQQVLNHLGLFSEMITESAIRAYQVDPSTETKISKSRCTLIFGQSFEMKDKPISTL